MTEENMSVAERVRNLLDYLGIASAHFAACQSEDWTPLVDESSDLVRSLVLISSVGLSPDLLSPVASRLLLLSGDSGPGAASAKTGVVGLAEIQHLVLSDYEQAGWSDIVADRTEEISSEVISFLQRKNGFESAPPIVAESEGEYLEVTYRIRGSGPPLVMLPVDLAPSQWEPAIPALAQHFTTITLGGRACWKSTLRRGS